MREGRSDGNRSIMEMLLHLKSVSIKIKMNVWFALYENNILYLKKNIFLINTIQVTMLLLETMIVSQFPEKSPLTYSFFLPYIMK